MTLNGVIAVILRFFIEFGRLGVNYIKVVKVRPILSAIKNIVTHKDVVYSNVDGDVLRDLLERVR